MWYIEITCRYLTRSFLLRFYILWWRECVTLLMSVRSRPPILVTLKDLPSESLYQNHHLLFSFWASDLHWRNLMEISDLLWGLFYIKKGIRWIINLYFNESRLTQGSSNFSAEYLPAAPTRTHCYWCRWLFPCWRGCESPLEAALSSTPSRPTEGRG